ncbi:class I SAM-dependent methyltransferase [Flavobacterium sp.]|uniref:class I SAM-dependent methyltransferase n=1 Tax=Flavobacterium sp. TaxID=239 RepID=UPI0026170AFF|nr:class I SAM-dependent methyltransferase [Flavobacterium sp.]
MNPKLLEPEVQRFIRENTTSDVTVLALQKNPFPYLEWAEVLNQVAARQKAKDKLPFWFNTDHIIYPTKVSVEQTSSEKAAQYKASLVSGDSLIDLTGGFGIDDFYFSKNFEKVVHCEMSLELSAIAQHNFKMLGADNIQCIPGDSTETLKMLNQQWDYIYIDPSRRNDIKGKVFLLKDCLPNVPELLDFYFSYSKNIIIKTAPLLDITAGLNELHSVKQIHIIALDNEVKELLWILEKGYAGNIMAETINIRKEGNEVFNVMHNDDGIASYSLPQQHLYEPNSAVMKSGAFDAVGKHFEINKLHKHTQLFTSDKLIDFPGRRFIIDGVLPYGKKEMKSLEGQKLNITTRNFPVAVAELRKKWKLKDGGDRYAFFTTNLNNDKIVLLCSKI